MQYLINLHGKRYVATRAVELPGLLLYSADAVYRSTNTGDFVCVKNRHGMMQPLSKESATVWMLTAELLDLSQFRLNR
jgi:hypothetical protein